MFSDESTFRLVRATSGTVRRPPGSDRFQNKYVVKTVKHPQGQMVWVCFSGSVGRGSLWFLPKQQMMNTENYLKCLEDKLIPFMKMHKCEYFLQVNIFIFI